MAARECAEMKAAVMLVRSGMNITLAAQTAGVSRRGLQNALKREEAKSKGEAK